MSASDISRQLFKVFPNKLVRNSICDYQDRLTGSDKEEVEAFAKLDWAALSNSDLIKARHIYCFLNSQAMRVLFPHLLIYISDHPRILDGDNLAASLFWNLARKKSVPDTVERLAAFRKSELELILDWLEELRLQYHNEEAEMEDYIGAAIDSAKKNIVDLLWTQG